MNLMKKSVAAVVIGALYVSLSACGMGDDVYHYWDVPFGAQYNTQEIMWELIDTCELTDADIVMVDLNSDAFRDTFRGDTCAQIRIGLAGYREHYGNQIASMIHNPVITTNPTINTNLPTTHGLQYALLSFGPPGSYLSTEVFVDFHNNMVSFGESITVNMGGATVVALSDEQVRAVLLGLEPLTEWESPWTQVSQPRDDMDWFAVRVIADDGVLYQWTGGWSTVDNPQTIPPDFTTVYDAFMALTEG